MKIFAESLVQAADVFLHAGYISAYPQLYQAQLMKESAPRVAIDMVKALLTAGGAWPAEEAVGTLAATGGSGLVGTTLLGLGCIAGGLAAVHLTRRYRRGRCGPVQPLIAGVLAALLTMGLVGWGAREATAGRGGTSRVGVKRQKYVSPALATKALLHGVLADAIFNTKRKRIRSLAQVRDEVSLPIKARTPGMVYALRTYKRDGWGRPFRLRKAKDGAGYRISSAGPDGKQGTKDDLALTVQPADNSAWPFSVKVFYMRKVHQQSLVFFHRIQSKMFKYHNQGRSRLLTGTQLYDHFVMDKRYESRLRFTKAFKKATNGGKQRPLMMFSYHIK